MDAIDPAVSTTPPTYIIQHVAPPHLKEKMQKNDVLFIAESKHDAVSSFFKYIRWRLTTDLTFCGNLLLYRDGGIIASARIEPEYYTEEFK